VKSVRIAVAALALALAACQPTDEPTTEETTTTTECFEDMPCFDCDTMGNMVCGPEQED
jgi:hypothetical protein